MKTRGLLSHSDTVFNWNMPRDATIWPVTACRDSHEKGRPLPSGAKLEHDVRGQVVPDRRRHHAHIQRPAGGVKTSWTSLKEPPGVGPPLMT